MSDSVHLPMPAEAQYLLRIDDLTPTMPTGVWPALLAIIERYRLQPILAIVPDNRDPALMDSVLTEPALTNSAHNPSLTPDALHPDFWPQMRALQSSGAAIALHGYRHLCTARGWGLVPLYRRSEFVRIPASIQRDWIGQGIGLLRAHGLHPTLWVAPRHGFDHATLLALRYHGITVVSDGFAPRPHLTFHCAWIPQQLWEPMPMPPGLWTICLHPATATPELLGRLEGFLDLHHARFTCVARVLQEWPIAPPAVSDRLFALRAYLRFHARRFFRSL